MTRLLDARSSQNASLANSISIPILSGVFPQLFGQIGLLTDGAGSQLRVQLKGTVTLETRFSGGPLPYPITITIVRGTLATDPVIYSAATTLVLDRLAPQVITFSASDFNPPLLPQLTYTAFVIAFEIPIYRVGPENFDGFVVSD
ncbi:hypothetical protein [Paenibacillus sp. DR312]|uniref:hypothetical protein n=1 Tax=unclassified Paenibacillus TaxID=185978 RepID=UPI001C96EDDF|nr:hypothetical protein [Paenibacillus sp. DR312]QZN77388.1 hypothetical protein K5K90_09410 [Paenibacillus sp. DR312]